MKKFIMFITVLFSLSALADTPAPPVITKLKPGSAVGAIVSQGGVITSVAAGTSGNVLTSNGTDWISSPATGQVTSVNAQTGAVVLDIDDVAPTQTGNAGKVLQTNGTNATWQAVAGTGTVTNVTSTDTSIDITSPTTIPDLALHFPITAPIGSVGAPSYRFDADTGIYSPGDGGVNISTNGVKAVEITNNQQMIVTGDVTAPDFVYPSKATKLFLASPNSGAGVPSFRSITQGDFTASALPFPMNAPGGTAASPSYNFDADSGMYSPTDGVLRWSTNGVQALEINNNQQITATNTITATDFVYPSKTANTFLAAPAGSAGVPSFRLIAPGDVGSEDIPYPLSAPGGSASAPSYRFTTDTGMFSPSSGLIGFSTNGVERMRIENNGPVSMYGDLNVTGNFSAANYPPVDDANTLAYFDASGVLHNLPNWGVDPNHFGEYNNLTADMPDGSNTNFSDHTYNAGMSADAPTANVTGAIETMNIDNAASVFSLGSTYMRRMELRLNGNGPTAYSAAFGIRHLLGNGSTTGTLNDGNAFDNYMNIGAGFEILGTYNMFANNSTIDGDAQNFYMINNFLNGGGTTVNTTGLNLGVQVEVTNNLQMAALSNNAPVGNDYSGIGIYSDSTVANNSNLINMNQTQNVGGQLIFMNTFVPNTVNTGGDYRSLQMGNEGAVGNNAAGALFSQNGAVAKAYTGVGAYLNADVGDGTSYIPMFDANISSGHVINGSLTGYNWSNGSNISGNNNINGGNWNNSGTGYRFMGLGIFNTADMTEEQKGIQVNLQGSGRTGSGLDVTMSGAYVDDVRGLRVNVDNVTTASTSNHVIAAEISGGNVSINGKTNIFSGANIDIGNYMSSVAEVASGSPVTGTDVIQQIFQSGLLLHDTIAPGPFGLGVNSTAMVPQIALDSGIILPVHRTLLLGTTVPQGSGGTITDGVVADILGYASFGGSLTVDNLVALQDAQVLGQQFCDYATNCWFMRVRDSRAETSLPKLAINTSSQKVSTGVRLELNDGHVKHTQTVQPTALADANAGSGATCSVSGTDSDGIIDLEMGGSGWAAGAQCAVTWNVAYNTNPICTFSALNADAATAATTVQPWLATSTTDMVMFFVNADTASPEYRWTYHCVEAF